VDLAFQIIFLGLILGAFWLALQPRYVWVVKVQGGVTRVSRGKVTAAFVQQVEDACHRNGVRDGWVGGVRKGGRVSLDFSRGIPPACRQQLRNEWALSG
jgi:hypothetical protein